MTEMTTNTDRLVELILKEDKDVLAELLTTDKVVLPEESGKYGYFAEMASNGRIVGKPVVPESSKRRNLIPVQARELLELSWIIRMRRLQVSGPNPVAQKTVWARIT